MHPTDADLARIQALLEFVRAGWPGARTLNIASGNDYTTIRITGSSSAEFLDALAGKGRRSEPGLVAHPSNLPVEARRAVG